MKAIDTKRKKWEIIYEDIKEKIFLGHFNNNLLTIQKITNEYKVSDITARRTYQELKKDNLIYPTRGKGTIIIRKEKVEDIFLVAGDEKSIHRDPFKIIFRLLKGFDISPYSKLFEKHFITFDFLFSHKEDFIGKNIIIFADENLDIEKVKDFSPIILHSFGKFKGVNVVGTDYYTGFLKGVEYLFNKGHKIIGFINGDIRSRWFYPRFTGYIDGLKKCGLEIIPEIIKITDGKDPKQDEKAIEEILKSKKRPTAILCGNDFRAINVLKWCKKNNIKVPDDLSIMGFDNIEETKFTNPKLTTIDSKLELEGDAVLRMLIKRKKGEDIRDVFIEPEIIERESVKEV